MPGTDAHTGNLFPRLTGVAMVVILATLLSPARPAAAELSGASFYATLDLTRPELAGVKAEVDEGDYAGADAALRDHYATRQNPVFTPVAADANLVDRAMDIATGHFEFEGLVRDYPYDPDTGYIDVDWDDTWSEYENPPVNAPSRMNRFVFYKDLTKAYLALPADDPRRDKLAVAWIQLARDFILDKGDVPIGAAPHNRLTEGIRLRFWMEAFSVLRSSTAVSASYLVAYLDYMRQSAREIRRNVERHKGNNWYISLARSIYLAGVYLPEFKAAPAWRFKAVSAADKYIARNMRSDGVNYEPALGYQNYALSLLATMQEFGQLNGDRPFTDDELSFMLLQAEAIAAATMPDFTVPLWGDTKNGALNMSAVATFAELFDRDDLRWVATRGASGQKPAWGSRLYPASYGVLRGGWDADDQYLFVGNQDTNYAASHRHPDDLSVVAYAHGRPLIVDPGVYNYSDSESAIWLRRTTEAHNTVEVDGAPQPKSTRDSPKVRRALKWYSNDGFDFYRGQHTDYSPVRHNRSVFSPKPGFWIVSDLMTKSSVSRDYRQLWHFPADAPVTVDGETVKAGFGDVPGVVVAPVDPGKTATTVHRDGYLSDGSTLHSGVAYASIDQTTSHYASFDTLLYPGPAGAAPEVATSRVPLSVSTGTATAMRLDLPDGAAGRYYMSHERDPGTRTAGDHRYDGRLFYVEKSAGGDLVRISLADGTHLTDGATTLVSSPARINDLSVTYRGSRLVLSTGEPLDGDVTIHAPEATEVVLNGAGVAYTRSGDSVTVSPPPLVPDTTLADEPFGAVRDGGIRRWRFVDDNTEHWQPLKGAWSVTRSSTGAWRYSQTDSETIDGQTIVPAKLDDMAVTTDVTRGKASAATHGYGVMLRYRDRGNHYKLRLYRSSGDVYAQIIARVGGATEVLVSHRVAIDLRQTHDLTGAVRGDRLTLAVDGRVLARATDTRLSTGGFGLWAHRTKAYFGDAQLDARTFWNFDDGTAAGWRGYRGSWRPAKGGYRQTDPDQNTGVALTEYAAADINVSVVAKPGTTGSPYYGYGIALRAHGERAHYMARIYHHKTDGAYAELYKVAGGKRTNFARVKLSLDAAAPHRLRARITGDVLRLWIDGRLVARATDTDPAGTGVIPTGGVGLQAHHVAITFDDVAVAEVTDPNTWIASRGHFADLFEDLKVKSIGVKRSRLNLARTVQWRDYVAEATIRPTAWNTTGHVGLAVRATGGRLGYRCVLAVTSSGTEARIARLVYGSRATTAPVLLAKRSVSFSKTGRLPVKVVARGSTIELWLDGVLLVSATDTLIDRGGVSVIGTGVDANVSHLTVRKLSPR